MSSRFVLSCIKRWLQGCRCITPFPAHADFWLLDLIILMALETAYLFDVAIVVDFTCSVGVLILARYYGFFMAVQ
jgi:hypothetical protein